MRTKQQPGVATTPSLAERRGRAMGSSLHILLTGAQAQVGPLLDWAVERVEELEQRWSRFLPTSEVSQLNAQPGVAVAVSADTVALVLRALEARRLSGGRFDPTLLGAMIANGYDRTFVSINAPVGLPGFAAGSALVNGISVDAAAGTITLDAATGFDPGGIGKGLAADMVAEELIERGATGALVNIGGDLRCIGHGPAGGSWIVACGDSAANVSNQTVELSQGAVATSTRSRRRWKRRSDTGVVDAHHLLDPTTGEPAPMAANLVTVIAGSCADAEWLATAIAAGGSLPEDPEMLGGAAVMLTACDGSYQRAGNPERFLR